MKRLVLLSLLTLILCACGGAPGGAGPNEMAGAAQGRAQDTAQAQANAGWAARQTADAQAFAAQATQAALAVRQTASAAQATSAADSAVVAAMQASAQLTVESAQLARQQLRETAQAIPTQAALASMATATEYHSRASNAQTKRSLGIAARGVLLAFLLAVCVIACVFLWWVSQTGRRMMDARASEVEARTMQALVREAKNGQIVDMTSGEVRVVGAPKPAGALPSGITRLETVKTLSPEEGDPSDLLTFITDAGKLIGWGSNQFPTADAMHEAYKYWKGTWQGYVDDLKRAGWLLTRSTGTYLTRNRTINDLYAWAASSPPPPPDVSQKGHTDAVERQEYAEYGQNAAYYVDATP